jgi:Transcriptional regulator, AbiEi antitoxin, Type IV TA system
MEPNIIDHQRSEHRLIHQFLKNLEELPEVRAKLRQKQPKSADAQIELKVAGKVVTLLVEAKKVAYPRDVQQAIWQLRQAGQSFQKETILVLIAEYLSPGAKEQLEAEHIGYYESGGSLYLPAPGAYCYIERPSAKVFERSVRSLFSGRRAQVLHGLLVHPQRWFGVHELAELAMVSPATVSEVFSELERQDWVTLQGKGPGKARQLCQPAALLDAWAKQVKDSPLPTMSRYYVPGVKADGLMSRIAEEFGKQNIEYAVSYESAAQRYAPFLSHISQVRLRILKSSESEAPVSALGARSVAEGSNLAIIDTESRGELLFRNKINDIWLASPVQVYLDLMHGEGRSMEMAEHLRKERIGF